MLSSETRTTQLEHYLDSVLRASLQKVLLERDALYSKASQCDQLRQLLHSTTKLSRDTSDSESTRLPHQMLVDLGHHTYMKANIPSMSTIHVNIGGGVVVPMSQTETLQFLDKKEALLIQQAEEKTKESLRVRYRIRLVMEALNRMQLNFQQPQQGQSQGRQPR